MSDTTPPIAKASAATNTTPQSVVHVKARPGVTVTYRLFAGNTTRALNGQPLTDEHAARSLAGFPFILGSVAGTTLKPLLDKICAVPAESRLEGRLKAGVLQPLSADEAGQRAALAAKSRDKTLAAEDRAAARTMLQSLFGDVRAAEAHVIKLPQRVEPGTVVGLCLGVDTKARFRKHALWQVTAGDHDIMVDVFETFGQHPLDDTAAKAVTLELGTAAAPQPIDCYSARLTGNVWMRSTHPFDATDVDALPREVADDTLKAALKRIYVADFDAMPEGWGIEIAMPPAAPSGTAASAPAAQPAGAAKTVRLHWIAAENGNCVSNISGLDVKREVPRRIHPAAYAAVANVALQAGVTQVSSPAAGARCWAAAPTASAWGWT